MKELLNSRKLRIAVLILADIVALAFSELFSLLLRYDFLRHPAVIDKLYKNSFYYLPVYIVSTIVIFVLLKIYKRLWQFASINEYVTLVLGTTISFVFNTMLRIALDLRIPRSCYILTWMIFTIMTIGVRVLYRIVRNHLYLRQRAKDTTNVMLIGAGDAGNMILREFQTSDLHETKRIACIIDDDKNKKGTYLCGVKVIGGRDMIEFAVEKYNIKEIIFAIPSANPIDKAQILDICKKMHCAMKTLPGISQLVTNKASLSSLVDVDVVDLLGREPIKSDIESIIDYVQDKIILVTGGGGSIGSELCRQIASHKPKRLVIFDIYENNAYDLQNDLKKRYPELDLVTLIGSVRDEARLNQIFEKYKIQIVFHAAAHKHVPLMEDSPNEAVKNNVFGTLATVNAAHRHRAERFILISTDKAVNPTNIMGATKRICEMIIQTWDKISETKFVAVRFGNVLGSNGSVIPLFKKQIEAGGPVTVTDPNIIRFFMTIPEAVELVLRAGALAKGGEIFILDMGHPVKIVDLAENLIRLSGHTPYVDINIVFTGLRPGEKLYEEILIEEEGLTMTTDEKIFVGHPINFDANEFIGKLENLRSIMHNDSADIKSAICTIVPIKESEADTAEKLEKQSKESSDAECQNQKEETVEV